MLYKDIPSGRYCALKDLDETYFILKLERHHLFFYNSINPNKYSHEETRTDDVFKMVRVK